MTSRLLARLEEEVRTSPTDAARLVATARTAAYLAKLGDRHSANDLLRDIRSQPRARLDGDVLGWVNLAEGLLEHYAGHIGSSREKWTRARAIAISTGCARLSSLSSAWLTFSAYLSEDLSAMNREAKRAISSSCADFPEALARLSLTLGLCFHYCGRLEKARENYSRCHLAASRIGDEVEISALIHDMAWMSTHAKRNAALLYLNEDPHPGSIHTSVESAINFQELIGDRSFPSLSPLLMAQDHILKGNWREAIRLITENINSSEDDGFSRLKPGLLADRAYCNIRLGEDGNARKDAFSAVDLAHSATMHGDDLAVFHSRLSAVFAQLGCHDEKQEHERQARSAWDDVEGFRVRMETVALELDLDIRTNSQSSNFEAE